MSTNALGTFISRAVGQEETHRYGDIFSVHAIAQRQRLGRIKVSGCSLFRTGRHARLISQASSQHAPQPRRLRSRLSGRETLSFSPEVRQLPCFTLHFLCRAEMECLRMKMMWEPTVAILFALMHAGSPCSLARAHSCHPMGCKPLAAVPARDWHNSAQPFWHRAAKRAAFEGSGLGPTAAA